MIPLAAPLIGAGIQGVLGLFNGRSKAKQAQRQAEMNAKLARIDTEYAPYGVASKGYKAEANMDQNSGLGGALSGAFAGGLQGLNVYRGLQGDQVNEEKLKLLQKLNGSSEPLRLDMSGGGNNLANFNRYSGRDQLVDPSLITR